MSLPKEPRQLMINIMYLVLTAMLALNVSAEIFNAFKILDRGLVKSSQALDFSNEPLQQAILEAAKAKSSLQTYADRVQPIRQEAKLLSDFISGIKDSIINASGGYAIDPITQEMTTSLKGQKDIDIPSRILVKNIYNKDSNLTTGEELKQRLLDYKTKIIEYIDEEDRSRFQNEITLNIDDQTWKEKGKASWSQMTFDRMPVQAVVPLINKYINDVKSTEAAALNYLGTKVGLGNTDVVIGGFTVVAAPKKSYIIKGEPYSADIFLTATAGPDSRTKVELSVNGNPLTQDAEGRGQYKINTSVTGSKTYTATAKVFNPITEKTVTYSKDFTYEVGERSVAISPTKMNVLYIGVENPIEISAAGTNSNSIKATVSGPGNGSIKKANDGSYIVEVKTPTQRNEYLKINVQADGVNSSKNFRVKRIPDPVAKLSNRKSGLMSSGEFRAQKRIYPDLENFDFEAECKIEEFRLVRVPRRSDVTIVMNQGGLYSPQSKALVDKAKAGDKFYFENIKCKCPGDTRTRDLGTMLFKIN